MAFTSRRQFNQGTYASGNTMSATFSVASPPQPVQGNIVLVGISAAFGLTLSNVKDGNNNFLSITPNSPSSANDAVCGKTWIAWYVAPANAHVTITATFTSPPSFGAMDMAEYVVTGATPFLDMDIAGFGATGTTMNSPSVVAASAGELLYAIGGPEVSTSGVAGPWSVNGVNIPSTGAAGEYVLSSSSGATAINITQASGHWDAMAASFTQTPNLVMGDDSQQITVIQQADNVISIW